MFIFLMLICEDTHQGEGNASSYYCAVITHLNPQSPFAHAYPLPKRL